MNVFFYATHTLYLKVLIPLMIGLSKKGAQVSLYKTVPQIFGYSPRRYSRQPIHNTCVNLSACRFAASLIGYGEEFREVEDRTEFTFWKKIQEAHAVIGSVKDLDALLAFKRAGAKRVYVLGYQHMPVLLSLSAALKHKKEHPLCEKVFLGENDFSRQHDFAKYIRQEGVCDYTFCNFLYMDKVFGRYARGNPQTLQEKKYVLIFHPGGYRRVITEPGEDKKACYRKQKEFLGKVCQPVLQTGYVPVIKVHPLFARYHALEDVAAIRDEMAREDPGYKKVLVTDQSYWPYALASRAVVTFGSSGVYELFAAGVKNVFVCNFFGDARSKKFLSFDALCLNTEEEYRSLFSSPRPEQRSGDAFGKEGILKDVYGAYASLYDGRATDYALSEVLGT